MVVPPSPTLVPLIARKARSSRSLGNLFPLRALHGAQTIQVFSATDVPPFDLGTRWSLVRFDGVIRRPQRGHRLLLFMAIFVADSEHLC